MPSSSRNGTTDDLSIFVPNLGYRLISELKLSHYGFNVGDVVAFGAPGLNAGGIAYRIVKDCPPVRAYWGQYTVYTPRCTPKRHLVEGWLSFKTNRHVSMLRLKGSIEIEPVYSFLSYESFSLRNRRPRRQRSGRRVISYTRIPSRIRIIDLTELGQAYAGMGTLINTIIKERS